MIMRMSSEVKISEFNWVSSGQRLINLPMAQFPHQQNCDNNCTSFIGFSRELITVLNTC